MKVSDQVASARRGLDLGNHGFFSKIAAAIQTKIAADTGLSLQLVGKTTTATKISATLLGQSSDPDLIPDLERKVRESMQDLKNPSALTGLLK